VPLMATNTSSAESNVHDNMLFGCLPYCTTITFRLTNAVPLSCPDEQENSR
jgi:hypothetical protein